MKGSALDFQGAVIKEQGVTFGIVIVKRGVLNRPDQRDEMARFGRRVFGSIPIVLMEQDSRGVPTYWGRHDIVRFLSQVLIEQIPWKQYTVAA